MPSPAAPTASESATTAQTDDVPRVAGPQPSRVTVVRTWEEPHPGSPIRLDAGGIHSGGGRGGMAAKGYGPYTRGRQSGARRRSRARARSMVVRPLEIPSRLEEKQEKQQPEILSAPLPTSPMLSLGETLLLQRVDSCETVETVQAPTVTDAGSETDSGATLRTSVELLIADAKETLSPGIPSPCLTFTDFSNFTGEATSETKPTDFGTLTVYDPDAFGDTLAEKDVYGWDAELERKLQGGYQIATCTLRPPGGFKRGFIQRVFSFGGTPRDIHFSE